MILNVSPNPRESGHYLDRFPASLESGLVKLTRHYQAPGDEDYPEL